MNTKTIINGGIIFTVLILLSLNASAETIVTGTIIDSYGAVKDAKIKVFDEMNLNCDDSTCQSSDVIPNPAATDSNGSFTIRFFPPDYNKEYNITITKEDYETKIVPITLNSTSQNQSIGKIELRGIAKVDGIIIDEESGRVIKKADVTIMDKGDTTDDGGRFLIENVTAEKWTIITVEHRDYEEQDFLYNIIPGDNSIEIKLSKMYVKDYAASVYTNYPSLIIGVGETKDFEINIKNIGIKDATYELELKETEEYFKYRILNKDGNEISKVFARSGEIVKIYIEVKIPDNVDNGEHEFKLRVGSGNDEVTLIADVCDTTGSYGFSASSMYRGKAVAGGSEVKFEISLENNATDDIYRLNATVPGGWRHYVTNKEGEEITEVEIVKGKNLNLYFKLEPPDDENEGVYEPSIAITSLKGEETKILSFQVTVRQENELYDVVLSSPFSKKSVMIGKSIEYSISIQNKGRKNDNYNLVVENLPSGWEYKFKESSGNAPQISSVEVDDGSTKTVVLEVNPASDVKLGDYPFIIKVSGNANDTLNATITIEGSHDMKLIIDNLHAQVDAGVKKQMTIKVQNTGLSELRDVELAITAPDEWDVVAAPLKIASLKPGVTEKFTISIEAPADASSGDFKVIVKAKSQEFETGEDVIRVTVEKSSSSGYVGFALIDAAVIFLILIFRKFGRK
ncbi:MAG: hypothetical protein CVT90_01410 [Candidatus Altiarchaeales archaeon HGW-Altiarchaeales-3]|nr:MAG: hypothetical protein CVT90_01410 [Candidatus Altiarchaeales archaeon HGW-Altiarchaeales-3]